LWQSWLGCRDRRPLNNRDIHSPRHICSAYAPFYPKY